MKRGMNFPVTIFNIFMEFLFFLFKFFIFMINIPLINFRYNFNKIDNN